MYLNTLTEKMIDELEICDIHVHLPGTINAKTAWILGVKNKLIEIKKSPNGYVATTGTQDNNISGHFKHYIDIFNNDFSLDQYGDVNNIRYNFSRDKRFKNFDAIMATVQGHRYPPGGIQNIQDLILIFNNILKECQKQKIVYVEMQQNIKIAYLIYPNLKQQLARKKLFIFFQTISDTFSDKGITLKFLHCFNKTSSSGEKISTQNRAIEGAKWLKESQKIMPNLFVGIESAGHEKDMLGWPLHLKQGYKIVKSLGLGCEAHGGEGIGVEHMMDVAQTLPIKRIAHGFQVIEDINCINYIKAHHITLIMTPVLNLKLGMCIHVKQYKETYMPCSKIQGGQKIDLITLHQHPFFELLRNYRLKITISSDNPNLGGMPLKELIKALANLHRQYRLPNNFLPLLAEELAILCFNTIDVIFTQEKIKNILRKKLNTWITKYNLNLDFIESYYHS